MIKLVRCCALAVWPMIAAMGIWLCLPLPENQQMAPMIGWSLGGIWFSGQLWEWSERLARKLPQAKLE